MLPAEGPELPATTAAEAKAEAEHAKACSTPVKAASLSAAAAAASQTGPGQPDLASDLQARLAKSEGERLVAQAQGARLRAELESAVEAKDAGHQENLELRAELSAAKQMSGSQIGMRYASLIEDMLQIIDADI